MEAVDQLEKANKIASRILSGLSVSEDEFRYMAMFNLTAITQILWELNHQGRPETNPHTSLLAGVETRSQRLGESSLWKRGIRLLPLLGPLAGFLAGLGIGYLIP